MNIIKIFLFLLLNHISIFNIDRKMDHDAYYYASSYQDEDEDFDDGETKNEMSGDALLISLTISA